MINLFSMLPFYDNRLEQNQYKENSSSLALYKYYSDLQNMIPWQIAVPFSVSAIEKIVINGLSCIYELNPNVNPAIKIVTDGTNKWVIYAGGQLFFQKENGDTEPLIIAPGFFEWQITAASKTYYSEVFYIPDPASFCDSEWKIKIEAWNNEPWNGFYFGTGFKFAAYFDTFIDTVITAIADDTVKDGFDRQILSQRVVTPTFAINFDPMPNIIAASLGVLTAMKNIVITERLTGNQYLVKNVKYTQDKVEGTSLDLVNFQFTTFDSDYISNFCNK